MLVIHFFFFAPAFIVFAGCPSVGMSSAFGWPLLAFAFDFAAFVLVAMIPSHGFG